jgi:WD40 repeat protein
MGTVLPKEEIEGASVNTIDEIQFLNGHTDIARYLIQIDSLRIASGSDDGKVIIWNLFNGEKLYTLKGHSSPITCMLILSVQESSTKVKEKKLLVTGSRDKTVRIWDIYRGVCLNTLTSHQGSVTCLVNMSLSSFCSAGNDRYVHFFNIVQ